MKISACLIARNEEDNLPRCLASLSNVCDEVLVVDSGSTDRTPSIAREVGARFIPHEWQGYVDQKNFALSQAVHPWVLSLDADEELSTELRKEIERLRGEPEPKAVGFAISRVVSYEGRWVRFGDWYPDWLIRLFRVERARFAGGAVHERLEVDGPTIRLKGELYHYTYRDQSDQLARIDLYSGLWAQFEATRGHQAGSMTPALRAAWRFFRSYLLKSGWKGGALGWRISRLNALEVYMKYKKLRDLSVS